MEIFSSEQGLFWKHANKRIAVALSGTVSAVADTRHRRVLAVQLDPEHGDQLYAFSYSGEELFHRSSPSDGRISYLTTHPLHGALVIVNLKKEIGGWPDWHYSIGVNGEFVRVSPAY